MDKIEALKEQIVKKVFVLNKDEQIDFSDNLDTWLFDFRKILMNGKTANLIADIFYESFVGKYPFQLGALEVAGVPLVTSFMTKYFYRGHEDINAFFIRKSRKKSGLMRMIEGVVEDQKKIILVDDILNSGNSFWRQVEILEQLGYKIDTIWSILRFRDHSYYKRFTDKGIKVESLFTLDDFTGSLGPRVKNLSTQLAAQPTPMPFTARWLFKSKNPSYGYVVSKSQPILDDKNIYLGSDNRTFWAISQANGSVVWQFTVGFPSAKKSIFSNPILFNDLVIFGSYDGNLYALYKENGKRAWVAPCADWIGSSPALAEGLGIIFVGLEFGLLRKKGGIVALNAVTGKTIWADTSHPALTHASPLYIKEYKQVAIGSNDGKMRLYNAKNGKLLWEFTTTGGLSYSPERDGGFGSGDIKESAVYDPKRDYLIFGSIDGNLYVVNRKKGTLVHTQTCEFGIYSTPIIHGNKVYFTSADRHVRCLSLDTLSLIFEKNIDGTRIFSSPTIINDKLYIGTNAGRLHEINPLTGDHLGYFQAIERITNTVIYNKNTKRYFLPTYANEIICLERT